MFTEECFDCRKRRSFLFLKFIYLFNNNNNKRERERKKNTLLVGGAGIDVVENRSPGRRSVVNAYSSSLFGDKFLLVPARLKRRTPYGVCGFDKSKAEKNQIEKRKKKNEEKQDGRPELNRMRFKISLCVSVFNFD